MSVQVFGLRDEKEHREKRERRERDTSCQQVEPVLVRGKTRKINPRQ
jgi:hypothetical protein